ncbi:hypothetical protein [Xanthomonas sp. 4461]|uniref:Uncharacterized protein n=1 Tax=Xanthomonas sp. 10-10 TaxID=3115848 RepID=A0AAU7P5A3_9XANT|nr:hypothetical protein [Xanthomonas sp. 4461]MCS3807745.1 hypothetical protein [Xanthomonas sp. 4461]
MSISVPPQARSVERRTASASTAAVELRKRAHRWTGTRLHRHRVLPALQIVQHHAPIERISRVNNGEGPGNFRAHKKGAIGAISI